MDVAAGRRVNELDVREDMRTSYRANGRRPSLPRNEQPFLHSRPDLERRRQQMAALNWQNVEFQDRLGRGRWLRDDSREGHGRQLGIGHGPRGDVHGFQD